jgi:secondary thiamine-phosphate synthase enzyme
MVYSESIKLISKDRAITFHNVTEAVKNTVKSSKIKNGIINVYSHHTTCSVITQEQAFDMSISGLETLQQDFVEVLEKFIPDCKREGIYLHPGQKALVFAQEHGEDAHGCHNTDAHLRSALIGRSETIAVVNSAPDLGEFGNVYFIDFDTTRARNRTVQLTVIGE